jgi:hypothetical protein
MAFDRKLTIYIGPRIRGADRLEVSGLDVAFNITRTNAFGENTGQLEIYNPKEATQTAFLREGNNVWVQAGYADDEFAQIYSGNIVAARSIREGPDLIVSLFLGSVQGTETPLTRQNFALSYAPKTLASKVIQEIADIQQLAVTGLENTNFQLPNGFTGVGPARIVLRQLHSVLRSNGIGLYLDSNELILYKLEGDSLFEVVALGYEGGLLSIEDVTDPYLDQQVTKTKQGQLPPDTRKRVSIQALLHPRVRPNGLVRIAAEQNSGLYLVEKVQFVGDNFGGDFLCSIDAVEPA